MLAAKGNTRKDPENKSTAHKTLFNETRDVLAEPIASFPRIPFRCHPAPKPFPETPSEIPGLSPPRRAGSVYGSAPGAGPDSSSGAATRARSDGQDECAPSHGQ